MNRQRIRVLPYVVLLLPFDLLVVMAFVFAELVGLPIRVMRRRTRPALAGLPRRSATIQILNWDGKHLLEECLPYVLEAVRFDGGDHEVLVVDNGSTDGSVDFVRERFPEVRVLPLDRNYRFVGGNNRGVREVRTDIVVLLNNDMIVNRAFLKPLLDGFSDPPVFAVTSQVFFADATRRREETGKTRARFERGFFYLWHDEIKPDDEKLETIPVFWAGGGACAYDHTAFRPGGDTWRGAAGLGAGRRGRASVPCRHRQKSQ